MPHRRDRDLVFAISFQKPIARTRQSKRQAACIRSERSRQSKATRANRRQRIDSLDKSASETPSARRPRASGRSAHRTRRPSSNLPRFHTILGENPIGTNAEITHALIGNNLKQVRATIPPGSSINADGELCDRWKTPYFFHQLSAKDMEIHSAGPDRIMGTGDDLVVK